MTNILSKCNNSLNIYFGLVTVFLMCFTSTANAKDKFDPRDLQGMWMMSAGGLFLGVELPYTAEGQNLAADRLHLVKQGRSMASPHLTCRPTGVAGFIAAKAPLLILQKPEKLTVIAQEDREVRHIYLDRQHPQKISATYSGHSIGQWQGDTFIVDTIGYNGLGQLDEVANPQSDQSHVVEKWQKTSDDQYLIVTITVTDPIYYTEPFTFTREYRRADGVRIGDYDCAENPREEDFKRMTFATDHFKPVCTRPLINGVTSEKVICNSPGKDIKNEHE